MPPTSPRDAHCGRCDCCAHCDYCHVRRGNGVRCPPHAPRSHVRCGSCGAGGSPCRHAHLNGRWCGFRARHGDAHAPRDVRHSRRHSHSAAMTRECRLDPAWLPHPVHARPPLLHAAAWAVSPRHRDGDVAAHRRALRARADSACSAAARRRTSHHWSQPDPQIPSDGASRARGDRESGSSPLRRAGRHGPPPSPG